MRALPKLRRSLIFGRRASDTAITMVEIGQVFLTELLDKMSFLVDESTVSVCGSSSVFRNNTFRLCRMDSCHVTAFFSDFGALTCP